MHHWDTYQVKGYFDKAADGAWVIAVKETPCSPELLQGRKISVSSTQGTALRRLGPWLPGRGKIAYFAAWTGPEDYRPPREIGRRLSGLYAIYDSIALKREIGALRVELRRAGAIERARAGKTSQPLEVWHRYTLDVLEGVIYQLVGTGALATMPPTQLEYIGQVEAGAALWSLRQALKNNNNMEDFCYEC